MSYEKWLCIFLAFILCDGQSIEDFGTHEWLDSASLLQTSLSQKPRVPAFEIARFENGFPLQHSVIPPILLMTGKYASVEEFPAALRANLEHTLKLTPGLQLKYMNDQGCRDYLLQHTTPELVQHFDHEVHGSFKGDICRTAVLLEHGGFYMDLDFQLHAPLHSLIESNTTLMTVYDSSQSILNVFWSIAWTIGSICYHARNTRHDAE
jgi:mannosyltransferase OCH1-like enzyme